MYDLQGSNFTTATTANAVTSSAFAVMPFKFGPGDSHRSGGKGGGGAITVRGVARIDLGGKEGGGTPSPAPHTVSTWPGVPKPGPTRPALQQCLVFNGPFQLYRVSSKYYNRAP